MSKSLITPLEDPNCSAMEEYGDNGDIMGTGSDEPFSTVWRAKAGWIDYATASASGEYELVREDVTLPGIKALKVSLGGGKYYWLEYRKDRRGVLGKEDFIQIRVTIDERESYRFKKNIYQYSVGDITSNPYYDPYREIKIEVPERTDQVARVRVTMPGIPVYNSESNSNAGSNVGVGCFIATAAYGSYLDPHVIALRNFRDKYLLTNMPGRAFVNFYYMLSPPIADFIRDHEILRSVSRWGLTPIVLIIGYPLPALLVTCLIIYVIYWRRKHPPIWGGYEGD